MNPTPKQLKKNCDHFLAMVLIDGNGNTRCSKCMQILSSGQLNMIAQKGLAYCEDELRKEKQ